MIFRYDDFMCSIMNMIWLCRNGTPHNILTGLWHNRLLLLAACWWRSWFLRLMTVVRFGSCHAALWMFRSARVLHFFSCFLVSVDRRCGLSPGGWRRKLGLVRDRCRKKVPFIIIASGWSFRPEVIIMISDIKWLYCLIHFHKGRFDAWLQQERSYIAWFTSSRRLVLVKSSIPEL